MNNSSSNWPEKQDSKPVEKPEIKDTIVSREQILNDVADLRDIIIKHWTPVEWKYLLWRDDEAHKKRAQEIIHNVEWDYTSVNGELIKKNSVDTINEFDYWERVLTFHQSSIVVYGKYNNPLKSESSEDVSVHAEINIIDKDYIHVIHSWIHMRTNWITCEIFNFGLNTRTQKTIQEFNKFYQLTLNILNNKTQELIDKKKMNELKAKI